MGKKYKTHLKILFIFFSAIALSIAFMNDGLITPLNNKRTTIYTDVGEGKIFGRLSLSKKEGIFSHGGLPGLCKNGSRSPSRQKTILASGTCEGYSVYQSHPGLQGHIFHMMNLVGLNDYFYYRLFAAIILGCVLGAFIGWIIFEFSFLTGIVVFCLLFFQNWLILLGDNISMLFGVTFIPLVIGLWYYYKKKMDSSGYQIILLFSLILLFFLNGAEFVFASMTMPFIPLLYYAIKDHYNFKYIISQCGIIGGIVLYSLIFVGSILFLQITFLTHSFKAAFFHFANKIGARTQFNDIIPPNSFSDGFDWHVIDKVPNLDILQNYIDKIGIHIADVSLSFKSLFILLGIVSIFLTIRYFRSRDRRVLSLLIVYWSSFIIPIFWICFFKGHSFFHIFLDPIVWYMPTMLLGMILVGLFCNG